MEKILVINNDFDTMSLLKDLLEKKAYQVTYTSSGEESIQIAKKFEPDVVLVDVLQKNCIEELRTHPATAYIPIILMTGYSWNEKTNEVAADEIIEKPFFLEQLQQKIQLTLNKKQNSNREEE
ncbi:MAG: response regulator [Ferruginibacter sp.]